MLRQTAKAVTLVLLIAALAGLFIRPAGQAVEKTVKPTPTVKIGMVQSLFKDVPEALVSLMTVPFQTLMQSSTGMKGDIVRSGDHHSLGKDLMEEKVHLGIFLGYEFALAKQKYPELEPLMIVVNTHTQLHAILLSKEDGGPGSWAGLKDQTLTIAKGTRPHCHMFLNKCCQEHCQCCPEDACKIVVAPTAEDAIDEVVDGAAQATLIDGVNLESYQRRKPGRFGTLKVVEKSETFPAAVVVFRPGVLTEDELKRFKNGMMNANKSIMGKQLLTLWKITGFEPVPAEFPETLENIIKAYPPPAEE